MDFFLGHLIGWPHWTLLVLRWIKGCSCVGATPAATPQIPSSCFDVVKGGGSVLSCPAWHLQKNSFLTVCVTRNILAWAQGPWLSPLQILRSGKSWQIFHVAKGSAQAQRICSADLAWAPVVVQGGATSHGNKIPPPDCSASSVLNSNVVYLLQPGRWLGV